MHQKDRAQELENLERWLRLHFPMDVLMPTTGPGKKAPAYSHSNASWSWTDYDAHGCADSIRRGDCDVGVLLADVLVIDVDDEELALQLEAAHPVLTESPCERTSRGRHYFLARTAWARDEGYFDGCAQRRRGVDLKSVCRTGSSGFIVVSPSSNKSWIRPPWAGDGCKSLPDVTPELLDAVAVARHPRPKVPMRIRFGGTAGGASQPALMIAAHSTSYPSLCRTEYFSGIAQCRDVPADSDDPVDVVLPEWCCPALLDELMYAADNGHLAFAVRGRRHADDLWRLADFLGLPEDLSRPLFGPGPAGPKRTPDVLGVGYGSVDRDLDILSVDASLLASYCTDRRMRAAAMAREQQQQQQQQASDWRAMVTFIRSEFTPDEEDEAWGASHPSQDHPSQNLLARQPPVHPGVDGVVVAAARAAEASAKRNASSFSVRIDPHVSAALSADDLVAALRQRASVIGLRLLHVVQPGIRGAAAAKFARPPNWHLPRSTADLEDGRTRARTKDERWLFPDAHAMPLRDAVGGVGGISAVLARLPAAVRALLLVEPHLVLAGSSVMHALHPRLPSDPLDYDMFVWGIGAAQAAAIVGRILRPASQGGHGGTLVTASAHAVTVRLPAAEDDSGCYCCVQVVTRLHSDPAQVIYAFDFVPCRAAIGAGLDPARPGELAAVTSLGWAESMRRRVVIVDPATWSASAPYRAVKYFLKGFEVFVPGVRRGAFCRAARLPDFMTLDAYDAAFPRRSRRGSGAGGAGGALQTTAPARGIRGLALLYLIEARVMSAATPGQRPAWSDFRRSGLGHALRNWNMDSDYDALLATLAATITNFVSAAVRWLMKAVAGNMFWQALSQRDVLDVDRLVTSIAWRSVVVHRAARPLRTSFRPDERACMELLMPPDLTV